MCFFDCKCKSLSRLRENLLKEKTGHPPARHSTANKYLSGSGWMSCVFVCFSRRLCLCVWFLLESFRVYMRKSSKRQCKNKKEKRNKKKTTFDKKKTKKKTEIQLIQPEPERYLFAVEWWAGGCPVCLFCFFYRRFVVVILFVLFLPCLFKLLHV